MCTVKSENQHKVRRLRKWYTWKLEKRWNLLVYNSWFLNKNWIHYELLKIKYQKIPETNTSEEIFKLTSQMKSKSCNLYVNGKLRTREIPEDQNYQILICKSKGIDPKSQRLISDERWTVLVKRQIGGSNKLRIWWICYPRKADEKRNPMKPKSSDLEL